MRDGKGYLLPENPQPDGLLCLKIYIPNDPTGYYLSAMSGAFSDMGRWVNWEKDGTNRARLAAIAWKEAIDFTYTNGWLNCMDCCDEIDDILKRIEELENMNINVNCGGCGCGCGCKNGSDSMVGEDGLPISTGIPPVPSTDEPENFVGAWLCDAANEFVDKWIDFYGNMFNLGIIGQGSLAAILSLAIAAGILTGGIGTILILIAAITILPAATAADWIRDWLVENHDGLVCAMVSAASPAVAFNNSLAYLAAHKSDQHGTFAGAWIERVIQPVFQDTDWNLLFTPDSFEISPGNVGSVCNCQQVVPLDELGEWYLVPAVEGEIFIQGNAVYQVSNYTWNFVATEGNQHCQSYVDFPEFLAAGRTWLGGAEPVATTGEHAGYVMERVGGSVDCRTFDGTGAGIIHVAVEDFGFHDVWTLRNSESDLDLTSFRDALETIFDGLDIVHEADATYRNANQHRTTVRGTNDDPKTMQFRIYAVISATALDSGAIAGL